jgi:plasmid maintenance system antidote protein VapI
VTSPTLLSTLSELGWSLRHLARVLGRPPGTVMNWTRDRYTVPADVSAWLARRLEAHRQAMRDDPPPMQK